MNEHDISQAGFAVRLAYVAAAGVSPDGKGFVRFVDGGTERLSPEDAMAVAGALGSGAETITLRNQSSKYMDDILRMHLEGDA